MVERNRDIQTAPATLPSISTSRANNLAGNGSRTAPASFEGFSKTKFINPAISPSTQKQNQKLGILMNLLNKNARENRFGSGFGAEAELQTNSSSFDKNWNELMQLIGMI
jgi:hypothetical protein